MNFSKITTKDYINKVLKKSIIILPIGAMENHGPHLPLGTDSILSNAFGEYFRDKLKGILYPCLNYTCHSLKNSGGGIHKPGTNCIENSLFQQLLENILRNIIKDFNHNILIINGHTENSPSIENAIYKINDEYNNNLITPKSFYISPNISPKKNKLNIFYINYWDTLSKLDFESITNVEISNYDKEHAGVLETSLMLYVNPSLVTNFSKYQIQNTNPYITNKYDSFAYAVLSDPSISSPGLGEKLFLEITKKMEKHILTFFSK